MPISPIVLQRRHAELGRIRLGRKVGSGRGRPEKLSTFRFTSASESYIKDLAELYGGTAQPWDNNGKAEFEVLTEASTIPVIAVKGGITQWMETWTGGGVAHRCDGERQADGTPCEADDPDHVNAKPTTRLSVMLPELDAIGTFRLESHGWNAAAEIPAVAELAQYVGDLVPAVLHLVERRTVKDGRTSRFVVPVLDLRIGAARLREIAAEKAGLTEIAATAAAAPAQIESGAAVPDYAVIADTLLDVESVQDLWRTADFNGHLTDDVRAALIDRANAIKAEGSATQTAAAGSEPGEGSPAAASAPQADEGTDEVVDAELVEDDADAVWQRILKAGGERGMSLGDVEDDFAQAMGGLMSSDASAAELQMYLAHLEGKGAAA